MRTSALLALAAAGGAQLAAAHATVHAIFVNDVDQGAGNSAAGYIRSPPNNSPLVDVTSPDMTCNINGGQATAKTINVKGGDKITFEWHHNTRDASDDIIDPSHNGPVLTYIAPTKSNGKGNVWLKLAEEGYSGGKWAVQNLIANRGKHSVTLPDLAAGEYLLRPEIIALHEGDRVGGAQFYTECVQIKVTSAGAVSLPAGEAIPGIYTANDPGVLFNLYNGFTSYPIPGPAVWDGASGSAPETPSTPETSSVAVSSSVVPTPVATKPAQTPVVSPVVPTPAPVNPTPTPVVSLKPTTFATLVKPATSAAPVPTSGSDNAGAVQKYGQCGGKNYSGPTSCAEGWTCKEWNPYYSQCVSA